MPSSLTGHPAAGSRALRSRPRYYVPAPTIGAPPERASRPLERRWLFRSNRPLPGVSDGDGHGFRPPHTASSQTGHTDPANRARRASPADSLPARRITGTRGPCPPARENAAIHQWWGPDNVACGIGDMARRSTDITGYCVGIKAPVTMPHPPNIDLASTRHKRLHI